MHTRSCRDLMVPASWAASLAGDCRACTLFMSILLGVLCPTLLAAHCWRPEHGASDSSLSQAGDSGSGRAKAWLGSLQGLAARCNRALHLALHCSSHLRHCLLVWWLSGYLWAACKAV